MQHRRMNKPTTTACALHQPFGPLQISKASFRAPLSVSWRPRCLSNTRPGRFPRPAASRLLLVSVHATSGSCRIEVHCAAAARSAASPEGCHASRSCDDERLPGAHGLLLRALEPPLVAHLHATSVLSTRLDTQRLAAADQAQQSRIVQANHVAARHSTAETSCE